MIHSTTSSSGKGGLEPLYLHKLVWYRNHTELRQILIEERTKDSNGRIIDPHPQLEQFFRGVTPLHLAVQLGYHECIQVLLEAGADCLARTELGYSVLQEATSLGMRELIKSIAIIRNNQIRSLVEQGAGRMKELLEREIPDFSLEFKWKFHSVLPFVSKYCPSDYCRLWKRGTSIRLDTTLYGMEGFKWKRSNISYLINYDQGKNIPKLFVVDHRERRWEEIDSTRQMNDDKLEEFTNVQLNMEILATTIASKSGGEITVKRSHSGLFFRSEVEERIGGIETVGYSAERVTIFTRIRTEHLREGQNGQVEGGVTGKLLKSPKVNKMSQLSSKPPPATSGNQPDNDMDGMQNLVKKFEASLQSPTFVSPTPQSRSVPMSPAMNGVNPVATSNGKKSKGSLTREIEEAKSKLKSFTPSRSPPPSSQITMEDFFMANLEDPFRLPYLHVGRPLQMTVKKKTIDVNFFMAPEFPLQISHLIPILNLVAPGSERMSRLINFLSMELPPGFPIKIEIPIFIFLNARVTFRNYKDVQSGIDQFYEPNGAKKRVEIKGLTKEDTIWVPNEPQDWFAVPAGYREEIFLKNILSE